MYFTFMRCGLSSSAIRVPFYDIQEGGVAVMSLRGSIVLKKDILERWLNLMRRVYKILRTR